ncbi:MAG: hypothetical protein ACPLTR_10540 [Thermacetogeniaceae bacterium]
MPVAEECLRLSAFRIPKYGRLRLEGNGRVVGIYATPRRLAIVSEGVAFTVERVKVDYGGRSRGGHSRWLICPSCHRLTWALFSPGRQQEFRCRRCLKLTYTLWKRNGYYRWPKDAGLWLSHFTRRAAKVLERSGRRVAKAGG